MLDCPPMPQASAQAAPPGAARMPYYDSAARATAFVEEGQALVRYRDLIVQLVSRSVKARYKRSFLGVAWTMVAGEIVWQEGQDTGAAPGKLLRATPRKQG